MKRLVLRASSNPKVAFSWLLIAVGGLGAGGWGYVHTQALRLRDLRAEAQRSALAFSLDEVRSLRGSPADLGTPVYRSVKERLRRLREVNPAVRFVAIFRNLPELKQVVFLADSEPSGSKNLSLPGKEFSEAIHLPGLQTILRDGQPATEGPCKDSFGYGLSGYAVIGLESPETADLRREVLALYTSAYSWQRELIGAVLPLALYAWLLLGCPFALLLLMRRYGLQEARIEKLSEAVEQSESAILIVNLESQIEYANAGLCRQTGYAREELIGHDWREFRTEATSPNILNELGARVRSGRTWEGEWVNRRKNGEFYPARSLVSPVMNKEGRLVGFIAVINDMSEQFRRDAKLREAKEMAEAADRAKGHFLATMSHEVRTPLNGIVGFTSLLLDTNLTSEQREYVLTIRTSGEALIQLTGDILDFSRIESGGLQLELAPCDVRASVEDALDLFASKAAEQSIHLLHGVDPDVPSQIMMDSGRVRQVLVNLIGNAVKFTPRGEVEVQVRILTGKAVSVAPFSSDLANSGGQFVAELEDGSLTLEFSVRDTGIGISLDDRPRLFQAFTQLDSSNSRRYGGAGLGLTISKNLVHLMGGDIWLESEPNRGSTFFFSVRVRPAHGAIAEHVVYPAFSCRCVIVAGSANGLRAELVRLLSQSGVVPRECSLAEIDECPWDLGLVVVENAVTRAYEERVKAQQWRPDRLFAIVPVTLLNTERQGLRPYFHMLINAPIHHRTLLELLAKASRQLETRPPLEVSPPALVGLRVLLVEDNAVNQRRIAQILENLGCRCAVADHGRSCLEELTSNSHDLVMMDLHMPEMDGLTATRQIRAGEAGPAAQNLWIIAITSDLRSEVRDMFFAAGVNDYLTKPATLADTEAALRRYLQERR